MEGASRARVSSRGVSPLPSPPTALSYRCSRKGTTTVTTEGGQRRAETEHSREHGDGRGPGRHAAVLARQALAQLVDGALGHAVADHPWERGRRRVRDHWPPLVCAKATTSGSRGGQEEEQDGHLWGERGRNVTFQVPLLSAWHLTLITKATRLTLLLLLRKLRLGHGGHRAQVHTHTCAEAKRRKAGRGPLTAACEQGRAAVTSAGFRVRPRGFNSQLFRLPPKKSWARSQNLSHPVTPSAKWG